jgi:hypothetical protein
LRNLRAKYPQSPFSRLNPLYALPAELLAILAAKLPHWFRAEEVNFEADLLVLCQRHNCLGLWHESWIIDASLSRPPAPLLPPSFFQQPGWDQPGTPGRAQYLMKTALGLVDPLHLRLDAYRGWLATNPLYCAEVQALKDRWGPVIDQLGYIPRSPVKISPGPVGRKPRGARDVTDCFVDDFNTLYDRWELSGLATWDLPQPRGANVGGPPLPASITCPPTTVSLQLSPVLSLPANYPLHALIADAQQAHRPDHLRDWFQVVDQQHAGDLRFVRLRRMFLLDFYRDRVLASRYHDRLKGHVTALDEALGQFLDNVSGDSIKKLRLHMAALRRLPP